MMTYRVKVRISYRYGAAASVSRHLARLMPANLPGEQLLRGHSLAVTPQPDEWQAREDFFGNAVTEVAFAEPHAEIAFELQSRVEVLDDMLRLDISPRLADLPDDLSNLRRLDPRSPHHFSCGSERAPVDDQTAAFARDHIGNNPSAVEALEAVGKAINAELRFDPTATTVDTRMIEAFEARSGVCQDFSHIMISALRGVGLPAGYVSGYLRTDPPEGQPRLDGADAMHAWVMAWCGNDLGWVQYDPTNAVFAGTDHIVVAKGRDYGDVSPLRGSVRTSGPQASLQQVDVVPIN